MTEGKFKKLVNLYLDREITAQELDKLKQEIAQNVARRNEFNQSCRIHLAERKALMKFRDSGTQSNKTREKSSRKSNNLSSQNTEGKQRETSRITIKMYSPPSRRLARTEHAAKQRQLKTRHIIEYGGLAAGFTAFLFATGLWLHNKSTRDTSSQLAAVEGNPDVIDVENFKQYAYTSQSSEPNNLIASASAESTDEMLDAIEDYDTFKVDSEDEIMAEIRAFLASDEGQDNNYFERHLHSRTPIPGGFMNAGIATQRQSVNPRNQPTQQYKVIIPGTSAPVYISVPINR